MYKYIYICVCVYLCVCCLFTSEATFRNFIVMQIRKPENEGILFREY